MRPSDPRIYDILDLEGTIVAAIEETRMTAAAEKARQHWPCYIKAKHLHKPYFINVSGMIEDEPPKFLNPKKDRTPIPFIDDQDGTIWEWSEGGGLVQRGAK